MSVACACLVGGQLQAKNTANLSEGFKATLYFDIGEPGGWVRFRTGVETGRPGILIELVNVLQERSGIQLVSINFRSKRAEKALRDGLVDFDCLEWAKRHKGWPRVPNNEVFF